MAQQDTYLASFDSILYNGQYVKIGLFSCASDDQHFPITESVEHDVFVFTRRSLWYRRGFSDYRFVERGGFLLHQKGATIERKQSTDAIDHTYWFAISSDIFSTTLAKYQLSIADTLDVIPTPAAFGYHLITLLNKLSNTSYEPSWLEHEVLKLFRQLCSIAASIPVRKETRSAKTVARRRSIANNAKAHIDASPSEAIKLHDLAQMVGSSSAHLSRIFRNTFGITIQEFRNRQRLNAAVDALLASHPQNLTDLALATGYNSHSHFTRQFRDAFGLPPSILRNALSL